MCSHAHCSQQHFLLLMYCHTFRQHVRQLKKRKTFEFFPFTSVCLKDCQGGGLHPKIPMEIRNHSINTYPQKSKMTSSLLPKLKTPLLTNTFLTLTYSHRFPTQQKQTFVYKLSLARHDFPEGRRPPRSGFGVAQGYAAERRQTGLLLLLHPLRFLLARAAAPLPPRRRFSPVPRGRSLMAGWRCQARSLPRTHRRALPSPGPSPARPGTHGLNSATGTAPPSPGPKRSITATAGPPESAGKGAHARGAAPPSP